MKTFCRTFALLLIPAFLFYTIACLTVPSLAYADEGKITQLSPKTAESEPVAPPTPLSKGISWWWIALGVVVIGAVAAGGGGGGGGGNSGGGSGSGSVNVGW